MKLKHNLPFIIDKSLILQISNNLIKIIPGKIGRINENLNFINEKDINQEISLVKYDKDPSNNKLFKFNSSMKDSITIGRSSICDIQIKNSFISKTHVRILFDKKASKWVLFDGCNITKPSSQGSHIIINDEVKIDDNTEIKFNHNKIFFNYIYPQCT